MVISSLKKYITILKNTSKIPFRKLWSFLVAFWEFIKIRYRGIIAIIILVTILEFVILSKFPQMPKNMNAELYLLSALSQSLAAIFALVFTITLVILRISYQFRGLLSEFFKDAFNIFYIILSAITIILPFWILRIEVSVLGINICLVLASTCVLFILPFFLRMKNFIEIQVGMRQLLQTTEECIQRKDINEYQNRLRDIEELMNQGLQEHQYNIIPLICKGYLILCEKCYLHFGTRRHGVSYTIKEFFNTTLTIDYFEHRLDKMKKVLYDIARLPERIQRLTRLDFCGLFDILTIIAMAVTAVKQYTRSEACCCAWILSIKWLKLNSKEEDHVKEMLVSLMTKTNQQFVIDCCHNMETILRYDIRYVFLFNEDEEVTLKRLKIWATKVNIEKPNEVKV